VGRDKKREMPCRGDTFESKGEGEKEILGLEFLGFWPLFVLLTS